MRKRQVDPFDYCLEDMSSPHHSLHQLWPVHLSNISLDRIPNTEIHFQDYS